MISFLFASYLGHQLVIAVAAAGLFVLQPWTNRLDFSSRLKLHYASLAVVLLSPLFFFFMKAKPLFEPVVKVWSVAPKSLATFGPISSQAGFVAVGGAGAAGADYIFLFALGLAMGSLLFGFARMTMGQIQVARILRRAFLFKQIGRVRILISDDCKVPFSCRTIKSAIAVVPSYLLQSPENFRLCVQHELQHHRQGDTVWAYPRLLLAAFSVINPSVYFWNRWIDEVQEFACDEALVGRQDLQARAYARCLVEVAETAWVKERVPVGATGLLLLDRGNLLNRRIQSMFQEPKFHGRRAWLAPLALVGAIVATSAFAAKGLVQDRRVTMAQAQALAKSSKSAFPVRVNEDVLAWLNRYVGTVEGRAQMKEALDRKDIYRELMIGKIQEYHVPHELMAIPIIESGYRNLPESNRQGVGAGLWMFIQSTARIFGMRVDANVDERLNEEKETDAAMRYLLANKLLFDNWELSVISYNAGEGFVKKEIARLGTRDAWQLLERGRFTRETRDYLPRLNAAILVMNNPSLIE